MSHRFSSIRSELHSAFVSCRNVAQRANVVANDMFRRNDHGKRGLSSDIIIPFIDIKW